MGGLSKGTYYVQAYAKNEYGIEFGEVKSFTVTGFPIVKTLSVSNISTSTAALNGLIVYSGDPMYTERGFVYSYLYPNPSVDDPESSTTTRVVSGTSTEFSVNIDGLTELQNYSVRAYITNSDGTFYGESVEFIPINENVVLVSSIGLMVQKCDISSGSTWSEAITLCENSTLGGYTDWYLPSRGELDALYENKTSIGGFSDNYYWSSTVYFSGNAWDQLFGNGNQNNNNKSYSERVRCVRRIN